MQQRYIGPILSLFILSLLIGAGCTTQDVAIRECYVLDDDLSTLLILTYPTGDTLGSTQAAELSIMSDGYDPMTIEGNLVNGRFVYPTGEYWEFVENGITGHEPNLQEGYAPLIDGLRATRVACGE